MYIPSDLLSSKMLIAVNGKIPNDLESKSYIMGEDLAMIRFVPDESGLVLIAPLQ